MKKQLIEKVFEIQKQIRAVLPSEEECEWTDEGMFVDPRNGHKINVLWRDTSYGLKNGEEYAFTWSTAGGFKGELPDKEKEAVMKILQPLKKSAPFIEVSNVDDVD